MCVFANFQQIPILHCCCRRPQCENSIARLSSITYLYIHSKVLLWKWKCHYFSRDEKADPAKIFWKYFQNIFKTNDSVGVTRQQTWLRNEKIAEYFGENLDILTDLLWIFNNSKVFKIYFQKILAGSPFFQALSPSPD